MSNTSIDYFIYKGPRWNGDNWKPDLSRCRFSVAEYGRITEWHQCHRRTVETVEGYNFCKQHANEVKSKLGIRDDSTTTKYAASFSYGKPNLVKLSIFGETEKTIDIEGVETLIGSASGLYHGKSRKNSRYMDKYSYFDDKNDAIRYLINQAHDYVRSTERTHEEAIQTERALMDAWYEKEKTD